MTRLSVIIPGFNTCETWWRSCIESVLKVISKEDEIICVDDGSDSQSQFLNEIANLESRVKVIFLKTNGGLASARNSALDVAQGRYVTFLDSDDIVCGTAYDRCVKRLDQADSDIAIYGIRTVWIDINLTRTSVPEDKVWGQLTPTDVKSLSERQLLNYSCNKVYRRSFLNGDNNTHQIIRFNQGGMPCEDIIFNLEIIMANARWCSVNEEGYVYFRRDGTLLSKYKVTCSTGLRICNKTWRRYKNLTPGARDILGDLGEFSQSDLVRREWVNQWLPGSPFSMKKRWRFLCENSSTFPFPLKSFVCQFVISFIRRYLYFRPFRHLHIRRLYPDTVSWSK